MRNNHPKILKDGTRVKIEIEKDPETGKCLSTGIGTIAEHTIEDDEISSEKKVVFYRIENIENNYNLDMHFGHGQLWVNSFEVTPLHKFQEKFLNFIVRKLFRKKK